MIDFGNKWNKLLILGGLTLVGLRLYGLRKRMKNKTNQN